MSGQVPKLGLTYWKLRAREMNAALNQRRGNQRSTKLTRILTIRVNFVEC